VWNDIRTVASELLQKNSHLYEISDLDETILSTGYPWALNSSHDTSHLIAVFAGNLRNGGGPGPTLEAFSKAIAAGSSKFFSDGKLTEHLNIASLARVCAEFLEDSESLPLAKNGTVDYLAQLKAIANSESISKRAILPQLLNSVVDFSKILVERFDGSAVGFHSSFNQPHKSSDTCDFVVHQYRLISDIPRIGVPLAMNFFKDSQVPSLRNKTLKEISNYRIGWFVKPDIHVLRFMLMASGRASSANITYSDLVHMPENDLKRFYRTTKPKAQWANTDYQYHSNQPRNESAQWLCIEDVHNLARKLGVAPLEIDRIFFMVGSGRFSSKKMVKPSQLERYQILSEKLEF